ncbi:MAG TPA: pilus assembly protein TadG-related protein [Bryobacteraceae bacterium]|nr:pilus assembly protein TadG-related protein [Bryobacteraceae bacterium]
MALPLLVILVPVLFGLMGFALDLGRLYLIKGELNQAANAMALAAAAQLVGTDASLGNATNAASQSLDNTNGLANKYNFGAIVIGQSSGILNSTVNPPAYFDTMADALSASATQASGETARYAQITLLADAPLLWWSLLPGGQTRKTSVGAIATAGLSAPLCTACQIAPFAVAAVDSSDTINFGFGDPTAGTLYTFYSSCTGTPLPASLAGALLPYIILNRYDTANATLDETGQAYVDGAAGLVQSTDPNPTGSPVPIGCVGINDAMETVWASAVPGACTAVLPPATVVDALCGLYSRFDNTNPASVCTTDVTNFSAVSAPFLPDTDVTTGESSLYTSYVGDGRRILTVPVVNALSPNTTTTMTVLGFVQFFLEPNPDGTFFTAADPNGRFVAMYIGTPAPVNQGWVDDRFALGCPAPVATGPGKVVLHQ